VKFTIVAGPPRAATEDEQRAIDKHRAERQRQEQKRLKHDNWHEACRAVLLWLIGQFKRTQPAEQEGRFLLTIAVRLLPRSERDRYLEEFRAELLHLPSDTRLWHALSLLRGVFVLRLQGDAKNKAADAVAGRLKE
jgi:hypothetical protein